MWWCVVCMCVSCGLCVMCMFCTRVVCGLHVCMCAWCVCAYVCMSVVCMLCAWCVYVFCVCVYMCDTCVVCVVCAMCMFMCVLCALCAWSVYVMWCVCTSVHALFCSRAHVGHEAAWFLWLPSGMTTDRCWNHRLKETKTHTGETSVSSISSLGKWDSPMHESEAGPLSYSTHTLSRTD